MVRTAKPKVVNTVRLPTPPISRTTHAQRWSVERNSGGLPMLLRSRGMPITSMKRLIASNEMRNRRPYKTARGQWPWTERYSPRAKDGAATASTGANTRQHPPQQTRYASYRVAWHRCSLSPRQAVSRHKSRTRFYNSYPWAEPASSNENGYQLSAWPTHWMAALRGIFRSVRHDGVSYEVAPYRFSLMRTIRSRSLCP
jgi:hypothetical protein